jgi:ribosome-associated protein
VSDDKPSKSSLKRQHAALQALGESLIGYDEATLAKLPLDEALFDAVVAARKMTSRGALRRQRQLIGKRMGGIDADELRSALEALGAENAAKKRVFATAERWRDRIVKEGSPAADAFVTLVGSDDRLIPLLNEYHRANSDRETTRLRRELFRHIHQALVEHHVKLSQ